MNPKLFAALSITALGIVLLVLAGASPAIAQPPKAAGVTGPEVTSPLPEATVSSENAPEGSEARGPGGRRRQPAWVYALWSLALPGLLLAGWGGILALFTLGHTFWPRLIQREYTVLIEQPRRALGWGVLWMVVFLLLAGIFSKVPGLGPLLGVLMTLITLGVLFLGLTGVAVSLGGQVLVLARRDGAPPLTKLAAGVAMILLISVLIPVFGQLLLFYWVLLSLGAFRLAITSLSPEEQPVAEEEWPDPSELETVNSAEGTGDPA